MQPGRYRHYKGNEYRSSESPGTETLEELVVYRQEYGEKGILGLSQSDVRRNGEHRRPGDPASPISVQQKINPHKKGLTTECQVL
ncbi:MAG: DUF1653 domain-containing protein [Planctomycetaceae bacterium]